MAIDFLSGFETGDFSEWDMNSGLCSVQGTIKHTGSYSCRFNPIVGQAYIAHTNTCTRVSFWLYFATMPDTEPNPTRICGKEDQLALLLDNDGQVLRLYDGTTSKGSYNVWFETGIWYRLSLSFNPTTNSAKVYLNGIEILSKTDITASSSTGKYYGFYNATTGDMYLDDIIQDDTESTDDIGDIRVKRAAIIGAGNYTEFDNYEGSAIHYENIDELSSNDADYNYNAAGGALTRECYALENCSSMGLVNTDFIMAVQTWCRMKRSGGGGTTHNILRRDNGSDYEAIKSLTTDLTNYFHVDAVMPNGGNDWTQVRFDAFEVGMSYDGGGQDPFISWVSVMVAYCPGFMGRIDAETSFSVISTLEDGESSPTGSISASSSMSGVAKAVRRSTGSFSAQSNLVGTAKVTRKATGNLLTQSSIVGIPKTIRRATGGFSGQSSLSGVAKVIRRATGIINSLFSLIGKLTKVKNGTPPPENGNGEEEVKIIQILSQKSRPDNQQVIGEGQVIIIGTESDNQQVMGEDVVDLDIDNVINR